MRLSTTPIVCRPMCYLSEVTRNERGARALICSFAETARTICRFCAASFGVSHVCRADEFLDLKCTLAALATLTHRSYI